MNLESITNRSLSKIANMIMFLIRSTPLNKSAVHTTSQSAVQSLLYPISSANRSLSRTVILSKGRSVILNTSRSRTTRLSRSATRYQDKRLSMKLSRNAALCMRNNVTKFPGRVVTNFLHI